MERKNNFRYRLVPHFSSHDILKLSLCYFLFFSNGIILYTGLLADYKRSAQIEEKYQRIITYFPLTLFWGFRRSFGVVFCVLRKNHCSLCRFVYWLQQASVHQAKCWQNCRQQAQNPVFSPNPIRQGAENRLLDL